MKWLIVLLLLGIRCATLMAQTPVLVNGGFEAPYGVIPGSTTVTGSTANGWADSSSGQSPVPAVTYSQDTSNPHTGSSDQQIVLSSSAVVQFIQPVQLPLGRVYSASVWLRASVPTTVSFSLQQVGSPNTVYLSNTSAGLSTAWEQFSIMGPVAGSGTAAACVMIRTAAPASMWVDDASLADITQTSLLTNGTFGGPYSVISGLGTVTGSTAYDWLDNSSFQNPKPTVTYSEDTVNTYNGGAASQKIAFTNGSLIQFIENISVNAGRLYNASIWVMASGSTTMDLHIQQAASPYATYIRTDNIPVGTTWTQITASGMVSSPADYFLIRVNSPATVWVGQASLMDATLPLPTTPIPTQYFGMNTSPGLYLGNNPPPAGSAANPPTTPYGNLRAWDYSVFWDQLQPTIASSGSNTATWGQTSLAVLDSYANLAQQNGASLILTLGQTPTWATTGTDVGYTYDGNTERGKVDYPSNIQYWINYLTALGTRYKGKIHYWEVWNEPGDPGYWAGTVQQMVTLTQVANSVLKGIDPSNQIMAPPDTTNPTRFLPAYLAAGGAANCDIIPYHYYTSAYTPNYPEQIIPQIGGVLQVMTSAGVYKPRWNTEQGWLGATPVISNTTAAAYVARTYLLNWPYGIQSANWFSWGYSTVEGINLTGTNNVTLSPAGIALSNVENWLLGATMTAITTDTNGTWQATITRPGGYQGEIIWNPSTAVAAYPVPNAWGVTQERKIDGTLVTFINISSIPVSTSPVILENQPALEATTGIAIGTGSNSTTLGGSVAPDGLATTYYFQYGPTTAYGFTTTGRTAVSSNPTSAALCNTVLSGLTPATTYHFQFVAANISGTNYGADQTFTTPPVAPTGLSGTAGNGQVILAWTPSTGATGYNVKRSLTSGGSYGNVGSSIATASYTDTGVTNDTTYYYVVSALDATAESTNSGQVSARPSAPITAAESAPPGVAVTGSNVQLTIGSVVAGHTYQLQYTNSLVPVPAQWTNLGAPQQSPISGTLILTDTTAYESGVPARFYRVSIQQ